MKNFLKKVFGITEMERAIEETRAQIEKAEEAKKAAELAAEQAVKEAEEAKKAAELAAEQAVKEAEEARLTPKERATSRKEPWVCVLDTKVNKDNVRNGFFELDWNEYFIVQLRQAGYGFEGDPEEEIVDRWFRDIVRNMLAEEGMDTNRGSGFINVVPINKNQSEVS